MKGLLVENHLLLATCMTTPEKIAKILSEADPEILTVFTQTGLTPACADHKAQTKPSHSLGRRFKQL